MAKTHVLRALRGRPARQLPIGVHAAGPLKGQPVMRHVSTGSTRSIGEADVPALEAHLIEQALLGSDYILEPIPSKTKRRRRAKGTRALARAASAAEPTGAPGASAR